MTTIVLMHLFQVYWNHGDIPLWLRFASSLGGTGGHVFVFCSGFGLYLSYLHCPMLFCSFLKKRFFKIYIPYILTVLFHFLLPPWPAVWTERIQMLFSHVFLYKMFFEKYTCSFGLQLWFISTLFQLYFLFIPLCRFREKTSLRFFVLFCLLISVGWWLCMHFTGLEEKRIWGSFCFQYLWEFALGMAAAEYMLKHPSVKIAVWVLVVVAVAGLSLQALMSLAGGTIRAFNDLPGLFGYTALVLLLYHYSSSLIHATFQWIDGISYEWYLLHALVFSRFYRVFRPVIHSELLLGILALLLSLGFAWLYARLTGALIRNLQKENC